MSLIWVLSEVTCAFSMDFAAHARKSGHEVIHTTDFAAIRFSMKTNEQAKAVSCFASVGHESRNLLSEADLIANFVKSDVFWQAGTEFELEEKRSALWALLSSRKEGLINRPALLGFFPWIGLLEFCGRKEIQLNLAGSTPYPDDTVHVCYVKGKLMSSTAVSIDPNHRDFWVCIQEELGNRAIDVCDIFYRIEGSIPELLGINTYVNRREPLLDQAVFKELCAC